MAPAILGLITTQGPGMAIISTYGWYGTICFHLITVGLFEGLAHRLGSRAVSQVHLTLFRFSLPRGVFFFSFLCFSGQVLRKKTMFECHVILERLFFSEFRKFRYSSLIIGCRYIHSPGSWLVVPGKHRRGLRGE